MSVRATIPVAVLAIALFGCNAACNRGAPPSFEAGATPHTASRTAGDSDRAQALRAALLSKLVQDGERIGPRTLEAMDKVPRHLFVPNVSLERAYEDRPQPIGYDQTISQPTIVGVMTEALELTGRERVLEIGTGSGYQAAILGVLSREVYTIEILAPLGEMAKGRLAELGYSNVTVRVGDGYKGWPEKAPFDRVIVTAAPDEIPQALVDQLADGGILVTPVGPEGATQRLIRLRKRAGVVTKEDLGAVRFVPMVPGPT
jgi:protein-L-isoaspartate(D-aspartate) O-methyltransferase